MKKIQPKVGTIIFGNETVVGEHEGLPFFTIGQRHIGQVDMSQIIAPGEDARPLYVVAKDTNTNTVYIGYEDDERLHTNTVRTRSIHWICEEPIYPFVCQVRLRHRQTLQDVTVEKKDDIIVLHFTKKQKAVTPGQFAVLYSGDVCLGGGVIA